MPTVRPERRQDEVLAFLGEARTYGLNVPPIRIDTHGAIVFLAGNDAYKVKRAVVFPYMDFSTLAKRRAACEAEMEVNRGNAPDIYLGVMPITGHNGGLQFGGSGPIVEWAVHMRRFDETTTLDQLARRRELTPALVDSLARAVMDSHRRAPLRPSTDLVAGTAKIIREIIGELETKCDAEQRKPVSRLASLLEKAFETNKVALPHRATGGYVRRCHGDLHLRNIVLIQGKPLIFDAIEFDDAIATIDILYDLAFLVMDLLHCGFRELACRLLNRYLWASKSQRDDIVGLSLLPMYLALRAGIRATVLAAQAEVAGDPGLSTEMSAYIAEAVAYLAPERPRVIAIGGLSGSGKSTISDRLAPSVGCAPGAVQLRSDIERKNRFGVEPTFRLGPEAYGEKTSDAVYTSLCELAVLAVRAGRAVILDATFLDEEWRKRVSALASDHGVPFNGIWLKGSACLLESRLQTRGEDASDATLSVLRRQLQMDIGKLDWRVIDASLPEAEILREIGEVVAGRKA